MSNLTAVDLLPMSPFAKKIYALTKDFVENECIPAEHIYQDQLGKGPDRFKWVPPILADLKKKARALGLWNLFLTEEYGPLSPGLTTMEYAVICELLGRSSLAPPATNCAAPDTGNMELLAKFGNEEQKAKWLKPLMEGEIRSTFAMTEPGVASSDATNISTSITPTADGKHYVINGHKHWQSNFSHPDTKVLLLVGKTRSDGPRHGMLSVVILPKDTPGIEFVRHMTVYGYDHAPSGHDELKFNNCKIPKENLILGEGRGFEILQGRLGGGRIHHAMRTLGVGQRALELMLLECVNEKKKPFGVLKGDQGKIQWDIAQSRIQLEQCKQLVYMAAKAMDVKGLKEARFEIAMAKVAVPYQVCEIIDRAMQVYGGLGVSQSTELAHMWAMIRHLRFADGPDEAHAAQLARAELKNAANIRKTYDEYKRKELELRKTVKSLL